MNNFPQRIKLPKMLKKLSKHSRSIKRSEHENTNRTWINKLIEKIELSKMNNDSNIVSKPKVQEASPINNQTNIMGNIYIV